MNYPYIVFYRKEKNPYIRYYQNSNPYVGSKALHTLEEVKEFVKTVDVIYIQNPAGRKITL